MKPLFKTLAFIFLFSQAASAQLDLNKMVGEFHVDMTVMQMNLQGTRAGEERLTKLRKDNFILMVYTSEEDNSTWAAMYNMGFNTEEPIWNGQCVSTGMAQFDILLDEMYDERQRIYHCSYSTENGISEINIDPFFAHMSTGANSGNELILIVDRR